VPGRTDRHNMDVPAGTYVLPADVVSGTGEDNTLAGVGIIDRMLSSGPYGTHLPPRRGGHSIPHPPGPFREGSAGYATAGGVKHGHGMVPVQVAGGEFLIPPNIVAYHHLLGNGDPKNPNPKHYDAALKRGHSILDKYVVLARAKHNKERQALPGPKK